MHVQRMGVALHRHRSRHRVELGMGLEVVDDGVAAGLDLRDERHLLTAGIDPTANVGAAGNQFGRVIAQQLGHQRLIAALGCRATGALPLLDGAASDSRRVGDLLLRHAVSQAAVSHQSADGHGEKEQGGQLPNPLCNF